MKHSDFHIGLAFTDYSGWWRCTDVGERTILATRLDQDEPPYTVEDTVFYEKNIAECYLTPGEANRATIDTSITFACLGVSMDKVIEQIERWQVHQYPHEGALRFDRKRPDGEILHPYAGRKEGEQWIIELYLPFLGTYETMAEDDFIPLPRATPDDFHARARHLVDI